MAYFEISSIEGIQVSHEDEQMVITFVSEDNVVKVALSPTMMEKLNKATLSWCPGMPKFCEFHENRLK